MISPSELANQVREALEFALVDDEIIAALSVMEARLERAENDARQLVEATAFYADFEESGHSDWSMATDTLVAIFGHVPPPGTPIDYAALARGVVGETSE